MRIPVTPAAGKLPSAAPSAAPEPCTGATTANAWLPLFPLHTVLFPNGILPLKIFETRYVDMVSACMKSDAPFGVVLIKFGQEAGAVAVPEAVGCLAHIVHWDMQANGILTLRIEGGRRFRIIELRTTGQLLEARVEVLAAPPRTATPRQYADCAAALHLVIDDIDHKGRAAEGDAYVSPFARPLQLADSGWVANRWSEILPIPLKARQKLLELDDAENRLTIIDQYLRQHGII